MTKDELLADPASLRAIADEGSSDLVATAYEVIFGKSISHCKECIKTDARMYLRIMAKHLEQGNATGYKIKAKYATTVAIQGIGELLPLTPFKIAAIKAAGFGYMLESIVPDEPTAIVAPAEQPAASTVVPAIAQAEPVVATIDPTLEPND
jgi:hypothetical protein